MPRQTALDSGETHRDSYDVGEKVTGLMPAVVVWNRDPAKLGRVKVRIHQIHGDVDETSTTELPWATVLSPYPTGYNYGTVDPPIVGSQCFVGFHMGSIEYPIVVGYMYSNPREGYELNTSHGEPSDGSMGKWLAGSGHDIPTEARDAVSSDPHVRVVYKSPKGTTIVSDERDGQEALRIIDRTGQVLEFECHVTESNNRGNKAQRTGDAENGGENPRSDLVGQSSKITLKDLAGQSVVMEATVGSEKITLTDEAGNFVRLDAAGEDIEINSVGTIHMTAAGRIWITGSRVDFNQGS